MAGEVAMVSVSDGAMRREMNRISGIMLSGGDWELWKGRERPRRNACEGSMR